ncbi:Uncharacterized protein PBTT_06870 [Plasmodiophora brassicae]|uniref:Uncharacterized protein n=1 Tax=Plasmodiophora brassicae TaxID=37360 RepID=A0A0G4J938_PLABS|nr:hypothetical protein PBRA_003503 [Plasmodiophora brassicae]SPQ99855.1 unnamed protein product [Plasmodiophora brassicae]
MAVIGRATVVMMIWAVAALLPRAALGDYYTSVSKDQSCGAYTDLNGINYLRCGCGAGMPPFANNGLKKDDQLEICVALYLSDGTHAPEQMVAGSAYYMQFSPLVDELTALSIVNGSNFLTSAFGQAFPGQAPGQNTHVAVNISVQVGPSFPSAPNHALGYAPVDDKRWQVHAGITRAVPYFTIIITLQGGQVTDVSWDDQCAGCMAQTDTCQSGFCTVDASQCGSAFNCDPTIYVGWAGTDKNGQMLTSSDIVPSQFIKYSIPSFWNNIASYGGGLQENNTPF